MPTLLITGATRGLGLATDRAAAARDTRVLVAGRTPDAVRSAARAVGGRPVLVDLARLDDVRAAAADLPAVDAVACNAAVQVVRGASLAPDGFETTFQVNHLAHLALVDALLARPAPPRRVAFLGSATHDPAQPTGMPAPLEGELAQLARDEGDGAGPGPAGRRRYLTTKLLAAATAAALARERPDLNVTCFDPGLMPDTDLARDYPLPVRLLLRALAPTLRPLPFASSPQASGRALARLLLDDPAPAPSGADVDHRLRVVAASARARDLAFQEAVLRDSRAPLGRPADATGERPARH
jgi:NAD(P)-dependent dehydrogenase (short-subunit alcohol dehydrogenase family)